MDTIALKAPTAREFHAPHHAAEHCAKHRAKTTMVCVEISAR
jgi:hypothetical protein